MTHLSMDFAVAPGIVAAAAAPLPPVSIAAFAATPSMEQVLDAVRQSRQLSRATMAVHAGGLDAALTAFAGAVPPQILVIDTNAAAGPLLAGLEALAQLCDPDTRVLVIGGSNDIGLYRALLRQGVSDYLPRPVRAEQIIRSLAEIVSQPGAVAKGAVTACLGTGGGVGSSTVALNLAWLLGQSRQGVVSLIDLDLDFGTAGLALALDGTHGIADAMAAGVQLDGQMLDGLFDSYDAQLRILAVSERGGLEPEPPPEVLDHLTDLARSGGHRVVLDLPGFASAVTRRALLAADHVVLTTSPDLAGLRNTRKLLDLVAAMRPGEAPPRVVLNRQGMVRRHEISAKDFAQTLGIELAATLAFDGKGFAQAGNLGKILVATPAGKAARVALQPLVAVLGGAGQHPRPARRPLLARLLHRR